MKNKYLILVAFAMLLYGSSTGLAGPSLGSAQNFAVLGASTVTNTGPSVINGDLGVSPGTAITGFGPIDGGPGIVNGNIYTGTAASQVHDDAIAAYAAAQTAPGGVLGPADLGGAILTPGVYTYAVAAPWATAGTTLTLNALGDPSSQWIFQIGSTLITPASATVALINGASANNVFWQVGTSATLGATNTFAGNILADQSIGFGGGTLDGRALAIGGAVTISVAETINVPTTVPVPGAFLLVAIGMASLSVFRKRALILK
ncbi:MAG: ice-binding family protein [Sedimentisphaerales bacterium]